MAHGRYIRFFQILVSKAKENHQKVVISYLAIFIKIKREFILFQGSLQNQNAPMVSIIYPCQLTIEERRQFE